MFIPIYILIYLWIHNILIYIHILSSINNQFHSFAFYCTSWSFLSVNTLNYTIVQCNRLFFIWSEIQFINPILFISHFIIRLFLIPIIITFIYIFFIFYINCSIIQEQRWIYLNFIQYSLSFYKLNIWGCVL